MIRLSDALHLARRFYAEGNWSGWETVPVGGITSVSAVSWGPGRIDLACTRAGSTSLWQQAFV